MTKTGAKIVILGAGNVGATFAYTVLSSGLASEIVFVDVNRAKAEGEVMDLNHGMPFVPPARVRVGEYKDCEGADLIVLTAGTARRPGESRLDLVQRNVGIFKQIIPEVIRFNQEAVLLVVTNPVDIMTYATIKLSGLPSRQVFGSGTVLDTARFKYLLSAHCGVSPRNVHAQIIGEHGDSEVPVWSLANISGMRLFDLCPACERRCDADAREALVNKVRNAGQEVIERKGATYYAIAQALQTISATILRNEHAILTVSTDPAGLYGIEDVCLSLPAVIGRGGIERVMHLDLSVDEEEALRRSADVLRNILIKVEW